jgi:hypothetical protein
MDKQTKSRMAASGGPIKVSLGGVVSDPLRQYGPSSPYVLNLTGCVHGMLFREHCKDCEIVGLRQQYKDAVQTVMRVRNKLRELGAPLPGEAKYDRS